jgi:hypothetical protein
MALKNYTLRRTIGGYYARTSTDPIAS